MKNGNLEIPSARSCQYKMCMQNIPHGSRVMDNFHKLIWHGHTTSQTDLTRTRRAIIVHTPKVDFAYTLCKRFAVFLHEINFWPRNFRLVVCLFVSNGHMKTDSFWTWLQRHEFMFVYEIKMTNSLCYPRNQMANIIFHNVRHLMFYTKSMES